MELRQWSFADTLAVKDMAVTSLTFLTSLTSTLVKLQFFNKISDSAGIQTQDLQNRNLTLYSTKLRSHGKDNTFAKLMLLFEITKYLCLFSVKKLQTGVGGRKVIHKFLAKIPKIYAIR